MKNQTKNKELLSKGQSINTILSAHGYTLGHSKSPNVYPRFSKRKGK